MAQTNAQRSRRWRERLKELARAGAGAAAEASAVADLRATLAARDKTLAGLKAALAAREEAAAGAIVALRAVQTIHDDATLAKAKRLAERELDAIERTAGQPPSMPLMLPGK